MTPVINQNVSNSKLENDSQIINEIQLPMKEFKALVFDGTGYFFSGFVLCFILVIIIKKLKNKNG